MWAPFPTAQASLAYLELSRMACARYLAWMRASSAAAGGSSSSAAAMVAVTEVGTTKGRGAGGGGPGEEDAAGAATRYNLIIIEYTGFVVSSEKFDCERALPNFSKVRMC